MAPSRRRFHGSAAPPPLRVTLGTGQPKLRSMWATSCSSHRIFAARAMYAGSTPYSCTDRVVSPRVEDQHREGRLVALDQAAAGDHLADIEAGALLAAERAERRVGDARHRRQHDRRVDVERAEPKRARRCRSRCCSCRAGAEADYFLTVHVIGSASSTGRHWTSEILPCLGASITMHPLAPSPLVNFFGSGP